MDFSTKQLREAYSKIPDELQEILNSEQTLDITKKTAEANGLSEEKRRELDLIVFAVFLGLIRIPNLAKVVGEKLETTNAIAQSISSSLKSELFDLNEDMIIEAQNQNLSTSLASANAGSTSSDTPRPKTIASILSSAQKKI